MINIKFAKLSDTAIIPSFSKTEDDACFDFYSDEDIIFERNENTVVVKTGIACEFEMSDNISLTKDSNFFLNTDILHRLFKLSLKIEGRSGYASDGIFPTGGIIDSGYRGEIKIILNRANSYQVLLSKGSKIAQGKIELLPRISNIEVVDYSELSETVRGKDGLGSTGK